MAARARKTEKAHSPVAPLPGKASVLLARANKGTRRITVAWDWTIKITDLAIVAATFFGPIVAVQAQRWLDRRLLISTES